MDAKTREYRKRMKDERARSRNGELFIEPYGLGRKNKSSDRFPKAECEFIFGGRKGYTKKRKKNGEWYSAGPFIIGGRKCAERALATNTPFGKRCLEHLGQESEALQTSDIEPKRARSKRKAEYIG